MSKNIIFPGEGSLEPKRVVTTENFLNVSELFFDTIQGEGIYAGVPAAFLRLAGCPVNCKWCDSRALWTKAKKFSIRELVEIFKTEGIVERLREKSNYHLIITGGSPMLQQDRVVEFLQQLKEETGSFFVEIENEASIQIKPDNNHRSLVDYVSHWNLSPKLSNSGIERKTRYNEDALSQFRLLPRDSVTFKFVVGDDPEKDWNEIYTDFVLPRYATLSQIMLMPKGCSQAELTAEVKERTVELAVREGVRYGGRIHIDIWDKKTGV